MINPLRFFPFRCLVLKKLDELTAAVRGLQTSMEKKMSELSDAVAQVDTDLQANTQAIADEQTSITGALNQLAADLESGNTDVPAAVTQLKQLATQLETNTGTVQQNAAALSNALKALQPAAPPAGGDGSGNDGSQPQA